MQKFIRNISLCLLLLIASATTLVAQERYQLRGQVVETDGTPLMGATVFVKGQPTNGTVVDINGYFNITVTAKDVLVVSMLSYNAVEMPVDGRKMLTVTLEPSSEVLEDIVIVGYGELSAKDVTGSIATIDVAKSLNVPTSDFSQALQGKVAGVVMSSGDGQLGEGMEVVIRGATSVTQDNTPLYVIDGFPIEDFSSLSLNPEDIKSISILKDASAGAIYGSRGSNGVIIVETKNGEDVKSNVSYSGSYGIQMVTNFMELMSPYEFVRYATELSSAYEATYLKDMTLEDYKQVQGTDWQAMYFRPAATQNHNISLSGRSGSSSYVISGGITDQEGVVINTAYQKMQGRMRLNHKIASNLSLNVNANYVYQKTDGDRTSEAGSSSSSWQSYPMYRLWAMSPLRTAYYDDEEFEDTVIDVTELNPITSANNIIRTIDNHFTYMSAVLSWEIIPDLKWNTTAGATLRDNVEKRFYNTKTYQGFPHVNNAKGVNGSFDSDKRTELLAESTLSYKHRFANKHLLNITASASVENYMRDRYGYSVTNIANESLGLTALESGTPKSVTSRHYDNRTISSLLRMNYSIASKYLFSASIRADGSSRFAKGNQWGYFPSAAIAWRFKEESWLKKSNVISEGKLRATWGVAGNNKVGEYLWATTIDYLDYFAHGGKTPSVATGPSTIANKSLTWEKTNQIDFGLDLGLFKNRVKLTADVYSKVTTDLLLNAYVPTSTGKSSAFLNVGSVQNRGLELTLELVPVKTRRFTWTSNFNIAFNQNEVLALADGQNRFTTTVNFTGDFNATPLYLTRVGGPIAAFYGYIWEGCYQLEDFDVNPVTGEYQLKATVPDNGSSRDLVQPGDIKYADLNGDGTITAEDMSVLANAYPIHTGGFSNVFTYKNFTLDVFLQWSYGNYAMNANRLALEGNYAGRAINQFASYTDRWSMDNQDSENFRAGGFGPRGYYSSRTLEDASYLRLKSVTLSYDLPARVRKSLGLSSAQIYVSGQNLFTWTKYSGLDPEVSTFHSTLTPGFDYSAYPRARVVSVGVKLGF
ncbi:MAG: TonB-dependent receptor [Tidjanibacter sp.]|nr:TonB-dependent receptor [Tidjanibacter sp.]